MAAEARSRSNVVYEGDVHAFHTQLAWLINNQQYSDVQFVVGETTIYGHKCIIATRCQFFKRLFDKTICHIDDVSPEEFLALLEFIYTNRCSKLNLDNIFDILSAANMYDLAQLVKICEDFLIQYLHLDRICESIEAAVTFGLDSLYNEAIKHFEKFALEIFRSDSFKEMSAATIARILQNDELNIDEFDACKAVRGWATVNSVALDVPISEVSKDVAEFIRLPLLSPEELSKIESQNKDNFIPVEQISQAWKYLALKIPARSDTNTTPRKGTKMRTKDK